MQQRINKIRQKMTEKELDAMLVTSPVNIYYLSGFTGTSAQIVLTMNHTYLLTDSRYLEQAESEAKGYEIVKRADSYQETLAELVSEGTVLGFEEQALTYGMVTVLTKALSGIKLKEASDVFSIRQIKDPLEQNRIKEAIKLADSAFEHIVNFIKVGMAETEIALELEFFMRKRGASGPSFDFIVASGLRSSMPHGVASNKRIEKDELLTIDYGAIYQGYCSDITRTLFVGDEIPQKQREIYNIVLEAQETGIEAIKPGLSGKEVDQAARSLISKYGYGEYFGHGLGHSLGLEVHESPNFNRREEQVLEPGMVLTVEPGIYIPGWGGVRIEDVVLVTKSGAEVLTQASKQFIIIH